MSRAGSIPVWFRAALVAGFVATAVELARGKLVPATTRSIGDAVASSLPSVAAATVAVVVAVPVAVAWHRRSVRSDTNGGDA